MRKKMLLVGLVFVVFGLFVLVCLRKQRLCLAVVTPARNIFTGECRLFTNSCLPLFFKKDPSCENVIIDGPKQKIIIDFDKVANGEVLSEVDYYANKIIEINDLNKFLTLLSKPGINLKGKSDIKSLYREGYKYLLVVGPKVGSLRCGLKVRKVFAYAYDGNIYIQTKLDCRKGMAAEIINAPFSIIRIQTATLESFTETANLSFHQVLSGN